MGLDMYPPDGGAIHPKWLNHAAKTLEARPGLLSREHMIPDSIIRAHLNQFKKFNQPEGGALHTKHVMRILQDFVHPDHTAATRAGAFPLLLGSLLPIIKGAASALLPMLLGGDGINLHQGNGMNIHQGNGMNIHRGYGVNVHRGYGVNVHRGYGVNVHRGYGGVNIHRGYGGVNIHRGHGLSLETPPMNPGHRETSMYNGGNYNLAQPGTLPPMGAGERVIHAVNSMVKPVHHNGEAHWVVNGDGIFDFVKGIVGKFIRSPILGKVAKGVFNVGKNVVQSQGFKDLATTGRDALLNTVKNKIAERAGLNQVPESAETELIQNEEAAPPSTSTKRRVRRIRPQRKRAAAPRRGRKKKAPPAPPPVDYDSNGDSPYDDVDEGSGYHRKHKRSKRMKFY
jgi:hypothetical protein